MKLEVDISPKMLRETLCAAQGLQPFLSLNVNVSVFMDRLQQLIDECDRHRPLGPDGKHGNRHTTTCGCEDDQLPTGDVVAPHGTWCDHTDCPNCFRAKLRLRKCLSCMHDWADPSMWQALSNSNPRH